jgi:hypothetical protein
MRQAGLARSIAQLDWAIAMCENAGDIPALRDLKEHVRLRDRLVAEFGKTLTVRPPRAPTLAEIFGSDAA